MGGIAGALGLEHFSREGFLRLTDFILNEIPPVRLVSAYRSPPPVHEPFELYLHPVFDLPLAGEKEMIFTGRDGKRSEVILRPGDVFQLPAAVWKLPRWNLPHEMACFVFQRDFVRITYLELAAPLPDGSRPVSSCFFHTEAPPDENMCRLLELLARLGLSGDPGGAGPELFRGLLRMVRSMLASDRAPRPTKGEATFHKIRDYLVENFSEPITREETARLFQLHPGYLSRLVREREGCTFSELLIRLRLEHAAMLLRETGLLVDEIADRCGYRSTTFFTAAFKRRYGLPPARFRSARQ